MIFFFETPSKSSNLGGYGTPAQEHILKLHGEILANSLLEKS
jgi:hypothetical protein